VRATRKADNKPTWANVPSTIFLVKGASETPFISFQRTQIAKYHLEQIAGRRIFDGNGPAQVVDLRQIDMLDVVTAIIILNLPTRPVHALYTKDLSRTRVQNNKQESDKVNENGCLASRTTNFVQPART
jgi:hypothetical protein